MRLPPLPEPGRQLGQFDPRPVVGEGNGQRDDGASTGCSRDLEARPEDRRPLQHAGQAEASPTDPIAVEPLTIVADGDKEGVALGPDVDPDPIAVGVANCVPEGLLNDPVDLHLGAWVEQVWADQVRLDRDVHRVPDPRRELLDAGSEAGLGKASRAEPERDVASLVEGEGRQLLCSAHPVSSHVRRDRALGPGHLTAASRVNRRAVRVWPTPSWRSRARRSRSSSWAVSSRSFAWR